MDVRHIFIKEYKQCGALKNVLRNRGLGTIIAKTCVIDGEIPPTALYGVQTYGV